MSAIREQTVALTTAPKNKYQTQSYNQPKRLSNILARVRTKLRLTQIEGLLGETLLLLQRPHFTANERTIAWDCFEALLERYIDLKYKGVRCG